MGVITVSEECATTVSPDRMYKALVVDAHNLVLKLKMKEVTSADIIEGVAGEVGCVRVTNFAEGNPVKYLKHRIDSVDKNKMCKLSLIEGDLLFNKIDKVVYTLKFEASSDGGCVVKISTEVHVKDGQDLDDATVQTAQNKEVEYYKVVAAHLLANPDFYA
ncbi:hypothetical protein Ddye_020348 [Dipteronia dyeriana]|uniref:Bet v I/Major latex protein domain-containing protein n=1 Tax=Dipteronia dyeriana TaxID=168575 RepID=A0AAD9WWG1_9ROSI|nr:hypothetical protein Ddye_020348 [Dipteronia dyeriana]